MKNKSSIIATKFYYWSILICIVVLFFTIEIGCSSISKNKYLDKEEVNYLYNPKGNDLVYVYSVKSGENDYYFEYYHYIIESDFGHTVIHVDYYDDSYEYFGFDEYEIVNELLICTKSSGTYSYGGKSLVLNSDISNNSFENFSYTIQIPDLFEDTVKYMEFNDHLSQYKFTDRKLKNPLFASLETKFNNTFTTYYLNGTTKCMKVIARKSYLYNVGLVKSEILDLNSNQLFLFNLIKKISFEDFKKLKKNNLTTASTR